jgi:VanZ family protein
MDMTIIWNSGLLMTVSGLTGMALSALADVVGIGHSGFGLDQAAGLVLGAFACLAGLVKLYAINKAKLGSILASLYIMGVLCMGLVPRPRRDNQAEIFWDADKFFSRDFFINTIGFVMVGYLLMLSLDNQGLEQGGGKWVRKAGLVVLAGGLLSFFVELSQYLFIPGRTSSSADLAANVFGTAMGILLYGVRPVVSKGKPVHTP